MVSHRRRTGAAPEPHRSRGLQPRVAKANKRGETPRLLIGSSFVYRDRLPDGFGLTPVVLNAEERETINQVIFDELCANRFTDQSRQDFVAIIERLVREEGAAGVILGCTEIPLLISQKDVSVPLLDSMAIHTQVAVNMPSAALPTLVKADVEAAQVAAGRASGLDRPKMKMEGRRPASARLTLFDRFNCYPNSDSPRS